MDDKPGQPTPAPSPEVERELDMAQSQLALYARDLKQVVEQMRESEVKFRRIADSAQDAILMLDNAGKIAFWNAAAERIFGHRADEALGQDLHALLVPPRFHEDARKGFAAFRETGEGPIVGQTLELQALRKGGEEFPVELSVSAMTIQGQWHAVGILRDISDRKATEQQLVESEARLRAIFDAALDGILVADTAEGRFITANNSICKMLGYSQDELLQLGVTDIHPAESLAFVREQFEGQARGEIGVAEALPVKRRDGSVFYADVSSAPIMLQGRHYLVGLFRDITERKRAEEAIRKSESRYRSYIEVTGQLAWVSDADGLVVEDLPAWRAYTGQTEDQLKGLGWLQAVHPDDREHATAAWKQARTNNKAYEVEYRVCRHDGVYRDFLVRGVAVPGDTGDIQEWVGTCIDITERKLAEETIRASRDLLGSIVENVPIRVFWKDAGLRYLGCNTAFAHDAGKSCPEELLGKDDFEMAWHDQAELYRADDQRVMDADTPKLGYEEPQTTPDGHTVWLRTSKVPLHDADGKVFGILGIYEDITAHKQAEFDLLRLNRTLRTLSRGNEVLVHAKTESELLQRICQVMVEEGGYCMAWIGYAEHDDQQTVRPVAQSGFEEGYLESIRVSWAEDAHGQGPTGTAIRTGRPSVMKNIPETPGFEPWREAAIKRGYASSIALPIRIKEEAMGSLNIYAEDPDAFDENEVRLLAELTEDLAYGIASQRSSETLHQTLVDTIQAIANTVEQRDPYTAGHQQRTAELAVAIAQAMGLDSDHIEGVRLGGIIHDIGKIYVPAEILNRPGQLSGVEFELVKSHPRVGYDIIKDVDFPWPVAKMILQHHERLDGSGYPQGLKGEDICVEARILAVADVVEAIGSHRPYRPSLGTDAALEEINTYRGVYYDPAAVDACTHLFRDESFSW